MVFHVLNRGNTRLRVFAGSGDYQAFEDILDRARERFAVRLYAYCLMPTHWHMVLSPEEERAMSGFVGWLTLTHAQRWHAHKGSAGMGHVYQGRFKSFPVQEDGHFLTLCRYVERNPLRAGLVERAEDWRWGSLWRRAAEPGDGRRPLDEWPVERPSNWLARVNAAESEAELAALRGCILRGRPYGGDIWVERTVKRLGLETAVRPRGRPPKRA